MRVEDQGEGIAGDFLPRIFELLTQAGGEAGAVDADSAPLRGMGIGLPLSKRIVELHHGTIEAKSDGPNKGTQIIVHLPVKQPPRPDQ